MLKFSKKYILKKESYSLKSSAIYVHIQHTSPPNTNVGSMNLAFGVSQNHHAVDVRTHWEKTNKDLTSYKMIIPFVFYFPLRRLLFGWRFFFFLFFFYFTPRARHWGNENKHELLDVVEQNNWSARHWQITMFCDNRVQ